MKKSKNFGDCIYYIIKIIQYITLRLLLYNKIISVTVYIKLLNSCLGIYMQEHFFFSNFVTNIQMFLMFAAIES